MKNKIFGNFRFKIMYYSCLSILIAAVVDLLVVGGCYLLSNRYLDQTTIAKNQSINKTQEIVLGNTQEYAANTVPKLVDEKGILIEEHRTARQVIFWVSLFVSIVLGFSVFFFCFQMFTRKIAGYVEEISKGIDEVAMGNLHQEIPVRGEDEITNIAVKLNSMRREFQMLLENERQYEREKDALITNVAHDLRTPLTSIIGYLDLVRLKDDLSREDQKKYVTVAYDKAKRLEKLIEDLFEFTKVGAERMQVHPMEIDFGRFMEQMVEEYYPSFESVQQKCKVDMQVERGILEADGNLLARGISNLFSNAVKYGKDGKIIKVKVKEDLDKKCMNLSITNYGKIIAPEDLEHIFDKFFRGEASRSTETGGSGLGLAIAKKVVLLHHGKISVSSDYNGTVFSIQLPLTQPREQEKEQEEYEKIQ